MKHLTLILLFLSTTLYAQPAKKEVFQLPELPNLSPERLTEMPEIHTFKHSEGIVLYHSEADHWQAYGRLEGYEAYGRIRHIHLVQKGLLAVSMEEGSVLLAEGKDIPLPYSILAVHAEQGRLYMLSSSLQGRGNSDYPPFYFHDRADQLLITDLATGDTQRIPLSKEFYRTYSWAFFEGKFWISALDDNPYQESYFIRLLRVDLSGQVEELNEKDEFTESTFRPLFNLCLFQGDLFLLSNQGDLIRPGKETLAILPELKQRYNSVIKEGTGSFTVYHFDPLNSAESAFTRVDLKTRGRQDLPLVIADEVDDRFGFLDHLAFDGDYFLFSEKKHEIIRIKPGSSAVLKRYTVREGIAGWVLRMAEDERDAWFVTSGSDIYRFSKSDSSWTRFTDHLDVRIDSSALYPHEIAISEDRVFISLSFYGKNAWQYFVFDRSEETAELLSAEAFRTRFLFSDGRFTRIPPEKTKELSDYDSLTIAINSSPEWPVFLFLHDLPLNGLDPNFKWKKRLIRTADYSMMGVWVWLSSSRQFVGVLHRDHKTGAITIIPFPKIWEYFDLNTALPIAGDDQKVLLVGHSGLLEYDFKTGKSRTEEEWYRLFKDISFVARTDGHVWVGTYKNRLFLMNEESGEIADLSAYVTDAPRFLTLSEKYCYITTVHEVIYFDRSFRYQGKLLPRQGVLFQSGGRIYLSERDSEKISLLEEK